MVAGSLTLWNCRLIDGLGGPAREQAAISIDAGSITAVAEAVGSVPPSDVVDLKGRSVVPGLIDAHIHLSSDVERSPGFGPTPELSGEDPRPRELGWFVLANSARELLRAGITTVRDVGSYDD